MDQLPKNHFTTGEFAKLHHINKRTLMYYDDIGLFKPQFKDNHEYRYYAYEQSEL
ncbi:MerR family DNA-binding transcriptional regulator [Paenibacillus terrigena]|nr:MerR family DNA-binding transcriptional regulator [Paenibacillus terrigena]